MFYEHWAAGHLTAVFVGCVCLFAYDDVVEVEGLVLLLLVVVVVR